MVLYCWVCKQSHCSNNQNLSFHRFPADSHEKAVWLEKLGLKQFTETVPKYARICSTHFEGDAFEIKPSGKIFLKKGACPLFFNEKYILTTETASTSRLDHTKRKSSTDTAPGSDGSEIIDSFGPPLKRFHTDSSATMTASEIDANPKGEHEKNSESLSETLTASETVSIHMLITEKESDRPTNSEKKKFHTDSSATMTASEIDTSPKGEHEKDYESLSGTLTASETELIHMLINEEETDRPTNSQKKKAIIDLSTSDFSTPRKATKNFRRMKKTVLGQKTKIKTLQQSVRRLKSKVTNLNSLINHLKGKSLVHEDCETSLRASIPESTSELFKRMLRGHRTQKYTPALRSFALTLNFYSTKAYNYVRKTFNNSLPHPTTISKWYQSVDGAPGWTQEAFRALKLKADAAKHDKKSVVCNLIFDEMSIRKQVEWTGKKFCGYVDIGTDLDSDQLPEAKEVLVFMLVTLNSFWKIPVGYFLLDGLCGSDKAGLVKKCLELIDETGVFVSSMTFDGTSANLKMASVLGADFKISPMKTYFSHPVTKEKVYLFLDPCHMIKLVRNCLGSYKSLKDADNNQVSWAYIDKLVDIQYNEGLHAATKLRKRHLMWTKEKMKVKIATQTLSKSVADSLIYLCKDLLLIEFKGAEATALFIRYFNDLFDIFNSKNRFAKYIYKKPLSSVTRKQFFDYLDIIKEYISHLSAGGVSVLKSKRKTGFLGFLICIESLKGLYNSYVETNKLRYILTYKLSQDHVELFFGAIRSRGGFNNNPTARQFEAAYKRLIVHSEIKAGETGNCVNLDATSILFCSSGRVTINENGQDLFLMAEQVSFEIKLSEDIQALDFLHSSAWCLTDYVNDIVCYMAGYVSRSLKGIVTCFRCQPLLFDENDETTSTLLIRKEYKNLTKASKLVVETCETAEKYFRFFHKTTNIFNKNIKNLMTILVNNTLQNLPPKIYEHFGDHLYDEDPIDGHSIKLLKLILNRYFKIRIHHETSTKLDSSTVRVRSILTKTVLFRNQ